MNLLSFLFFLLTGPTVYSLKTVPCFCRMVLHRNRQKRRTSYKQADIIPPTRRFLARLEYGGTWIWGMLHCSTEKKGRRMTDGGLSVRPFCSFLKLVVGAGIRPLERLHMLDTLHSGLSATLVCCHCQQSFLRTSTIDLHSCIQNKTPAPWCLSISDRRAVLGTTWRCNRVT